MPRSTVFIETLETKSLGKSWVTLATVGVYLHWLGLYPNEACPLRSHARMDGDHLLQCTGLDEYPNDEIVSRYWEARVLSQIVKKPSTGVG
ncbi:hypothetical protein TNCV_1711031 [Trichonephila clavipes]|nr:hypothetical protein TNCV_1711031 [Trichonephila clavipes]